ncbi:hypothetical protein [Allostreptomyces psammosilenae]|uniref:Uncharacterized protein n=1 Tax=Allostreptomyces psammosilenae TaxID=1892865 RepID=A0A852ZTQ9_9ACTN|nr:hypothetical protein [Allostreptomyces psammosilenae]NYI05793.1 hypothetical protein [Allostreptomyces psammosilenae]
MTKLLLSVHVLAAILAVGPITVAASMFPRYARQLTSGADPGGRTAAIAALLHRICRGYAVAGLAVPAFGLATGAQLGVLTDAWLIVSMVLTAIAAGVLAFAILPAQQQALASSGSATSAASTTGETSATGATSPTGREAAATKALAADATTAEAAPRSRTTPGASRLAALTGAFNLLWAIVVVLMIVRPGSTTGV